MSPDPFNFGRPPNEPPRAPGGQPVPGGQSNPFGGSGPSNPLPQNGPQGTRPGPLEQQPPPRPFGTDSVAPGPTFGPPVVRQESLAAAQPPTWLLFLAAGLALAAAIVAVIVANPIVAIVCWLVAGPVAIGLLALFVIKDTYARSSGLYAAPGWVKPLHTVAIVVCFLCILAPALRIADWVGRL